MSRYPETEPVVEELGESRQLPKEAELGWWGSTPTQRTGLLRPVAILAQRAGLIIRVAGVTVLLSLLLALILPHRFVATVRFVPEVTAPTMAGALVSLAGQAGLNLDLGRAERSPAFYASVLLDRAVLDRVVQSAIDTVGGTATVLDVLEVEDGPPARRLYEGGIELENITDVRVDPRNNIITLSVEWRNPVVAAAIANLYFRELLEFNRNQRASSGRATREFLAGRLAQTREELQSLEDSLQLFLERNRVINDSPELVFRQQRLRRAVELKARLVESLQHEHEQARIREVNTTPALSLIHPAQPPPKKEKPRRKRIVMVGGLLGTGFGVLLAFTAEFLERARRQRDPDITTLEVALKQMRARTRRLLGRRPPATE